MGLFTPKYPKSDTPGATVAPGRRTSRSTRNQPTATAGNTADDVALIQQRARQEAADNDRYYRAKAAERARLRAKCSQSNHDRCLSH